MCEKCPNSEIFLIRIFLVFGLNKETYFVNLRYTYQVRENAAQKNSEFGHFSNSDLSSNYVYS